MKEKSQNWGQKDPPVFQKDLDLKDVGVKHNLQIFKNLEGPQEIKTELLL